MPVKPPRNRDDQADATRAALLTAARRLFARSGYPDVSIDQIVHAARVTKGALYHHFKDKKEIFSAVVEQILQSVHERLAAASSGAPDAEGRLRAACHAYLDACVEDEVGRTVVLDSPSVLGWEHWCKLNRQYGLGFFADRLRALRGEEPGLEATAQVLLGALNTAGRVIAQADDRAAARAQVGSTIDHLISSSVPRTAGGA